MDHQIAYSTGLSLSKATQLFKAGRTAFEAIEEVRNDSVLFKEMSESAKQHGTLCGKNVSTPSWVEHLVLITTYLGEVAGIYDLAWQRASDLLLPTLHPTDAAKVREALISLGIKADQHQLINPCLPVLPLPVWAK